MLNIRVVTWSPGVFTLCTYLICIVYGLIVPTSLHMAQFLEITLPGFHWLTFGGWLIGVVESFLYGVYAGLVYTLLYNFFYYAWGISTPERQELGSPHTRRHVCTTYLARWLAWLSLWDWRWSEASGLNSNKSINSITPVIPSNHQQRRAQTH